MRSALYVIASTWKLSKDACSKKLFSIIQSRCTPFTCASHWNVVVNLESNLHVIMYMHVRGIKIKMALNNKW